MFNSKILILPIISILFFGTLSSNPDAFAGFDPAVGGTITVLDSANTDLACESLGGVWSAPTCTVVDAPIPFVVENDILRINPGVILETTCSGNVCELRNDGRIELNGSWNHSPGPGDGIVRAAVEPQLCGQRTDYRDGEGSGGRPGWLLR